MTTRYVSLYITEKQARRMEDALANVQFHFAGKTGCNISRYKWEDEALFRLRAALITGLADVPDACAHPETKNQGVEAPAEYRHRVAAVEVGQPVRGGPEASC